MVEREIVMPFIKKRVRNAGPIDKKMRTAYTENSIISIVII